MDWTIYSIGDIAYLEAIFNGLANIVGTGDFMQVIQVAFLLGVVMICIQSVYRGGEAVEWQVTLVSLIVFLALFGPSARVNLEDAYTGQVRTVDNTPLGVAAIGSILSNAGYEITQLMEQAYGTPSQTQLVSRGFGSNTSLLSQVRRNVNTTTDWADAADAGTGSTANTDLAASWEHYVADCTMKARDLHQQGGGAVNSKSHQEITMAALPEALKFDSDIYGTKIIVGGTQELTCADAYDRLEQATLGTAFEQDMYQVLAARMSVPGVQSDAVPSNAQVQTEINNALSAFNVGAVGAQQYVVASALLPAFQAGVKQYHYDYREMMQAAQVNEAINQRNSQWKSQESVFASTIRPMMTFMEGLFYAIAPIIAFFIPFGSWGLSLAPKFLLLAVWIQLWLPMLAIVNLYQQMIVERKMVALSDAGLGNMPIDSIAGMMKVDQILQNWQATGSMLASSVPLLAAVVTYGGNAFMMSRLMSQMSGSENVDPSTSTPDVSNTGAAVNHAAAYDSGINSGIAQQNADQLHAGLGISQSLSASEQSAQQAVEQNRESFSSAMTSTLQNTYGDQMSLQQASKLGEQFSASDSNVAQLLQSQSETYAETSQSSAGTQSALTGALVANAGGSGGISLGGGNSMGSLGASAGAQGSVTDKDTLQSSETQSESLQEQLDAAMSEVDKSQLQEAIAADISEGRVDTNSFSSSDSASADFRESAEKLVSSQQSYSAVEAMNEQYSGSLQAGASTASKELADNHGGELAALTDAKGLTGEVGSLMENGAFEQHFPDPDQREAAAQMQVLAENGHADELAAMLGFGGDGSIEPGSHAGVGDGAAEAGERARAEAEVANADTAQRASAAAGNQQDYQAANAAMPTASEARDAVSEQNADNIAGVESKEPDAEQTITDNALREVNDQLNQPPETSTAQAFAGYMDEAKDVGLSGIADGAVAGITAYDSGEAMSAYHQAAQEAEAGGSSSFAQMMYGTAAYWSDVADQQGTAFAVEALANQGTALKDLHQAAYERGKSMELTDTQAEYFASQSINNALETLGGEAAVEKAGFSADAAAVEQELTRNGIGEQEAVHARQYIDNAANVPTDNAEGALSTVVHVNEVINVAGSSESALDTH